MLTLLIDMCVLWFLLNIFSEESWDDRKLTIFGIALAISILGGVAMIAVVASVGILVGLGVYFLVGTICLWGLASLKFPKAAAAMGIFLAVKFLIGLIFAWMLST